MKNTLKTITLTGAMAANSLAIAADPLVDSNWIKQHSCDENIRVLDI